MTSHKSLPPDLESYPSKLPMRDRLPPEGLKKHDNFVKQYQIYFKSQKSAAEVLKVNQVTVSKQLSGVILVSMPVAERFSKFTNGVVARDDIYFDYEAYVYDQKAARKKKKNPSLA